jgi:hypothetical protein
MAVNDMFPSAGDPSLYGPNSRKYFTTFNREYKEAAKRQGVTADSSRDAINEAVRAAHSATAMTVGMTEREASKADQAFQKEQAIRKSEKLSPRTDKLPK